MSRLAIVGNYLSSRTAKRKMNRRCQLRRLAGQYRPVKTKRPGVKSRNGWR